MWKKIEGFDRYSVSDSGEVRNDETGRILKPCKNKVGYYKVALCVKGKKYQIDVHRLVAEAFIPNPNNYTQVNHKDERPENNFVSNLEWVSAQYNANYGNRTDNAINNGAFIQKKIYQTDTDGELIGIWSSQKLASRVLHINQTNISRCLHNVYNTAGGYKWSYVSPLNNNQNAA